MSILGCQEPVFDLRENRRSFGMLEPGVLGTSPSGRGAGAGCSVAAGVRVGMTELGMERPGCCLGICPVAAAKG